MKAPSNCPFCNDPMINDFPSTRMHETQVKRCSKRANHNFSCSLLIDSNEAFMITIIISHEPFLKAVWNLTNSELFIFNTFQVNGKLTGNTRLQLPYFIPDLNNWNKLMNKLKLYLTFS